MRARSVVTRANPLEDAINSLTVALKNSPINQGKKALAKAQAGSYDAQATRAKIENLITDNKVLVFSWTGCPFCKNAKALLTDVGAQFTAVELDTLGQEGKAIRAELAEMTDRTSVPNIWINGQNVGGCNDGPGVMTLHKQGQLVPMLKAAGAM
jgi:glutaredoxin 3